MFNIVAKHKRVIMVVFILLIVPPFAFFGLESYTRSLDRAGEVANVDGIGISEREFEEARRAQLERLRSVFGAKFDAEAFDTPQAREAVIETLVTQRLVAAAALGGGLAVSDATLRDTIRSNPAFQRDGGFDLAAYRQLLLAQGMNEQVYEQRLRQDLAVERLAQAIADTAIASRSTSEWQRALESRRWEVAEALIPAEAYAAQVKIDDARLKTYYDANRGGFKVPERLRAEYLVLSAGELGREDAVTEDELKAAYAAREKQSQVAEQRQASHILVKTEAEAKKLLAEARKAPARFAELAKKFSQDPGSAQAGGDLGMIARGMMLKPFEDAVFAMKEGEIAGPVQTEFGFHVIRLTAIQASRTRTLDELRKELTAEIARQKGSRRFAEAAEGFSQMVYEQSDSLAPAAQRFKLAIQQSDWLARSAKDAPAPFDHAKLRAALFTQDAIEARRNTDAVEVAPGVLVSARVVAHEAERQRAFEDVKSEIRQILVRQDAAKLAREAGEAKLALLEKKGEAGLQWSAPGTVSTREIQRLAPEPRRRILAADAAGFPLHVGEARGEQGYAIYRVLRLVPAEPRDAKRQAEDLAAAQRRAGSDQFDAWLASQRAGAKVELNRAALERK